MGPLGSVGPIGGLGGDPVITRLGAAAAPGAAAVGDLGFASVLTQGMRHVESKVATADALVRQFALDDSVPLHQVTYALEEARLAVELAMQVRTRLVESYRELMNMQL